MIENLDKLRAPFPAHQISYLPKGGVKLAYVGHAALTDRLLDTDATWTWEPLALDERGLPALDEAGGLWIRLTVCGVTRLGYGDAGTKKGGDAMKERIGDALRNAAMRFGAALDLWHKGDLHGSDDDKLAAELRAAWLDDQATKLEACTTVADLGAAWKTAYKAMAAENDDEAIKTLAAVKDRIKAALEVKQ
jgi:hypothetical protein